MKQSRIMKLSKQDWMIRTNFNKRDSSWMKKYRKKGTNNEEGE